MKMFSKLFVSIILLSFVLVSCGASGESNEVKEVTVEATQIVEKEVTVEVTRIIEKEVTVEVTQIVEKEVTVEVTQIVEVEITVEPTDTPPTKASETKLGDTVELNGRSLTSVSVIDPAVPSKYTTVDDGNKIIAVEIILENTNDDAFSVNPLSAMLVDSEGFTYSAQLGGTAEQISTSKLLLGEKIKGLIAFQVPESATASQIRYEVSYVNSEYLVVSVVE